MECQLRDDGVAVGGKRDFSVRMRLRSASGRKKLTIIKCRFTVSEFMATHFAGLCSDQCGERQRGSLVIADPRTGCVMVSEDTEPLPVLQLLLNEAGHGFGLQPQGVAGEIGQSASIAVMGMMELVRKAGQGIGGIAGRRSGRVQSH